MTIKRYQAPILKKAFGILKAISGSDAAGLRISDISACLDISKSTVHGIAGALEEEGALIRDPATKRYRLGPALLELGRAAYGRLGIQKTARPVMEQLMRQCRESVFLGIRNAHRVTIIDVVESSKAMKITSPAGTSMPLLAGAVGKALIAAMPEAEAAEFLRNHPLPVYTPRSIGDTDSYTTEIDLVRQQGFALDDEEYLAGVWAVAIALTPRDGLQPALWVVGFKSGMPDGHIRTTIRQACTAAGTINAALSESAVPASG